VINNKDTTQRTLKKGILFFFEICNYDAQELTKHLMQWDFLIQYKGWLKLIYHLHMNTINE
jgi:hypothetical protein